MARQGEIVHGHAEDHRIGGKELIEHDLALGDLGGDLRIDLIRLGIGGHQVRAGKMRQRVGDEIAIGDGRSGLFGLDLGGDGSGQAAGYGMVSKNAGVDVKNVHGSAPLFGLGAKHMIRKQSHD